LASAVPPHISYKLFYNYPSAGRCTLQDTDRVAKTHEWNLTKENWKKSPGELIRDVYSFYILCTFTTFHAAHIFEIYRSNLEEVIG
jgi:hypothetical protein